jgi:hypothetical protein
MNLHQMMCAFTAQSMARCDKILEQAILFSALITLFGMSVNLWSSSPGDIINTGTPEGVGMGFKPTKYLKPGQTIVTGIEGIGEMTSHTK